MLTKQDFATFELYEEWAEENYHLLVIDIVDNPDGSVSIEYIPNDEPGETFYK